MASETSAVRPSFAATRRLSLPGLGSGLTLAVASGVGIAGFLYPFFLSEVAQRAEGQAHAGDAPLVFAMLVALAGALFLLELASGGMNAKVASALAVLAAAAAVLRLPPLPGGASAFFFLVILSGYVFGPRFGFLVGALGMLISAFANGGFGPWVPYQMFAAGWIGLTSGWLGALRPALSRRRWLEMLALLAFGAFWGFAFGAAMNLWFWPYLATGESIAWQPGLGLGETLRRYWSFYVITSAGWDAWAAIGNVVLLAIAGRPLLTLLARYRDRFQISFG
jgi:energy-coupling factor transport system substrate-specific component